MENEKPLCLVCADLGHLEYLPSGDPAVTKRATKHSKLRAVVVRWSTARRRYERQGILAEPEAIEKAQSESLGDAALRQELARRRREKEVQIDREFVSEFADRTAELYPKCPAAEAIAKRACRKYSGRVGRTAAAKAFHPGAIMLAVQAYVRHARTHYDVLLASGLDRSDARREVRDEVDEVLSRWKKEQA